ncbi:DUF1513 domain-containing protein [Mesorhizobium sp. LHD-90]|uniref:DUF1513 domain-containing protein n=1 Tax=Mesorhizobium sp. LHD-90 TaxID=3071414 RepID=UPI0027E143DC|nr:DUF1513 domain-containing protein [Mesorhizobium sp. LHD-90]MDQ6435700.1 DUF1513 domain-containing protein [Mesorhizobium sp. LHD-90]
MRTPLFDRRDFLKAAGASFVAALAPAAQARTAEADALFASAYQNRGGGFGVAILTEQGKIVHSVDLPDRGHDITFDPVSRRSVVFARQPGTFAVVFDHTNKAEPVTIPSVAGRHFFGHGVFSPDGKLLYATENDFDNSEGMIGIYDATDAFRRIGEFPTHGVGPHELLLCPDGKTLAIANGGIETHPDFGAAKLNIPTMKPSLVFVDRETGDLVESHELPPALHKLSIRHMDFDRDGTLWFGCQHEGPATERPALVGRARMGERFELVDLPETALIGLRNYVGSVAANPAAGTVAISSPQGNSLVVLDAVTGAVASVRDLTEVCGIAPDSAGFLASTGTGEIVPPEGSAHSDPHYVWDNHMLRIEG